MDELVTPEPHVVIVGAGLAGLRTAESLRKHGHRGRVTLLGDEPLLPYDRPPLSKQLLARDKEPVPVYLRRPDTYADLDVEVRTGVVAAALDLAAHEVVLGSGERVGFDRLVVATGSRARRIPGLQAPGVHLIRTFEDCLAVHAAFGEAGDGLRAGRLVVVGGGVLGCETASSARSRGLEVALVEPTSQPLGRVLGEQVGAAVARLHRSRGVDLHLGVGVAGLEGDPVSHVVLTDGTRLPADVVVVAVGAEPSTGWLESSGLEVEDGVVCDATGAASAEHVFAVGDVARMPLPGASGAVRLEHWTHAADTAFLVGANLAQESQGLPGRRLLDTVAYVWSDQHGAKIQVLGLPRADDEVAVVAGDLAEDRFLALYHRDGEVTGAVTIGMVAALARCRPLVAERAPLAQVLSSTPWISRDAG